jgi:hypothetical protein
MRHVTAAADQLRADIILAQVAGKANGPPTPVARWRVRAVWRLVRLTGVRGR